MHVFIFIPHLNDSAHWLATCVRHCITYGYAWDPVILRSWADVVRLMRAQDTVVVCPPRRLLGLDPDRLPRLEPVDEVPPETPATPPSARRAGRRRKPEADR